MRGMGVSASLPSDAPARGSVPGHIAPSGGRTAKSKRREFGVELQRSTYLVLEPHPERQTDNWRQWALEQNRPRAVDLFCGGGGLSLGLEDAGYRVILAVDHEPTAVMTHAHNFPGTALQRDLAEPEALESLCSFLKGIPIDLIAGCPPCQPFSRAGRAKIRSLVKGGHRDERDPRTQLWLPFVKIVETLKPAAVLMENVPDMALGDDLATVRQIIARLELAGYEAEAALLDACRHGVPQHRQRLILVGTRNGAPFAWPKSAARITLADAISDLPRLGKFAGEVSMPYSHPKTAFQKKARRGMGEKIVLDHVTRSVRDDDRRAFQLLTPGMRYSELPKNLKRYRDDIFNDKYNRLAWGELSRSITAHIAKDGYWYIHPSEHRTLTVREAARVQTFPDRYRFAGTRSSQFHQIGNAVPPALATAVATQLLKAQRAETRIQAAARPSQRLSRIRQHLLQWGRKDALKHPWRHPADPWAVLAGVVLDPRAADNVADAVRGFLAACPKPGKIPRARIALINNLLTGRAERAVDRLLTVAPTLSARAAWESGNWAPAAGLGSAEESFVRIVGLGEDGVLSTAATLRVAARLSGQPVDRQNKMSAGRMVVGSIVGSGETVPAVNAALNALGATVCRVSDPLCGSCPVARDCSHATASAK